VACNEIRVTNLGGAAFAIDMPPTGQGGPLVPFVLAWVGQHVVTRAETFIYTGRQVQCGVTIGARYGTSSP